MYNRFKKGGGNVDFASFKQINDEIENSKEWVFYLKLQQRLAFTNGIHKEKI